MIRHTGIQKAIFFIAATICLTPYADAPIALVLGVVLVLFIGNPFPKQSSKTAKLLLKVSIVGLGFGMNFHNALKAGKEGLLFTVFTIVFALVFGWILGRWLKTDRKTSYLVSSGTAICGGSAVAAVAPAIAADDKQISVALGTVFILNPIALLFFPLIGSWLELSQQQFGIWSAIAIHDTSSVVGVAQKYGEEALGIVTTIKMGRGIVDYTIVFVYRFFTERRQEKNQRSLFIGFFILAMLISTFTPHYAEVYSHVVYFSKKY